MDTLLIGMKLSEDRNSSSEPSVLLAEKHHLGGTGPPKAREWPCIQLAKESLTYCKYSI
jgi:hypothetical protein